MSDDLVLVAAIGIDAEGGKHPLALVEGATENTATVSALLDNLVERGLDPAVSRLFIVDGAKALSKAIRATFGKDSLIQRCQVHKARNIMDRLPKELHASTRRVLRQAWELDDAAKAEKLIRNLARRLDQDRPGVSASILEGLDEILTVVQLKLPMELRRSLACTNIAENMMGTIRRVTRNVKRWRNGKMALRWVAAGMIEAPRASANSRLTSSCRPCAPHLSPIRIASPKSPLLRHRGLRNMISRNLAQPKFNKLRDIPTGVALVGPRYFGYDVDYQQYFGV